MRMINSRRCKLRRVVCPECREPVRRCPPDRWLTAIGPRPRWSHLDGEPLCPVIAPGGSRPARPRRVPTPPARRTITPPATVTPPAPDAAPVYVVAGGDLIAVFDNPEAAGIMFTTMTGANLEPVRGHLTPAQWEAQRASLARLPGVTIVDTRPGHENGAS